MNSTIYVRCYSCDEKCWDDGIGYVIAAASINLLDKHVESMRWRTHSQQTFEIEINDALFFFHGDVIVVRETDD